MIWIVYILNLAISTFNAWSCGRSWAETKRMGGMAHFMNWCGAIMSASGFTWCLLVLTSRLITMVPKYGLPEHYANAIMAMGYLIIILPVLGSGIAITVQSWAYFWKERNFKNGAVAGWNTFAQIYNVFEAAQGIPEALKIVGELFNPDALSEDDGIKTYAVKVVIGLVVVSVVGGILTTTWIIRATARNVAMEEKVRVLEAKQAQGADNRRWA